MKYMLDTNICIYLIKQKPIGLIRHFQRQRVGEIGISSITASELFFGVEKSQLIEKNRTALEQFLLPLMIEPFGIQASMLYGRIRANLEKRGMPIGPLDTLIAAHALSLDTILVTNNEREFGRIHGLKVENWTML